MSIATLREIMETARSGGYAAGAFNIFNQLTAAAVISAAEQAGTPVILQTSAATVKKLGSAAMADYLLPLARRAQVPVALHLDHSASVALCLECIDAGWTAVMYDGSREELEVNVRNTLEVVAYAKRSGASVEGEIGAIAGVEDDIHVKREQAALASPEGAAAFAAGTGVDALAPAIGTAHGMYTEEPRVDFELFAEIAGRVGCGLVVHGGTGLPAETFARLIRLGASKINVSTAIKRAYIDGIGEAVQKDAGRYNPLAVDKAAREAVIRTVMEHIGIFHCRQEGGSAL